MSILDFLKKEKPKKEKKEAKTPPKVKLEKKPAIPVKSKKTKISKPKTSKISYRILKSPHITEKATDLTKKNQYVFKVWPKASKIEIKKAIKETFGTDAVSVQIIKIPRKRRRMGRISGWRKGYKKAVVKLKKGQKIEVLPR